MFFRVNGKIYWCWKYVSQILAISGMMVLFSLLLLDGGMLRVHAYESISARISSREARLLVLELFADGKLVNENSDQIITQTSDGRRFKIFNKYGDAESVVYLTPEINNSFDIFNIGTWEFRFGKDRDLLSVSYYFQTSKDFKVEVKPYLSSMEVSLMVKENYVYQDLLIPMGIRNFLRMPLDKFIDETYAFLHWDWVFPDEKFININERSKNLANYLSAQMKDVLEKRKNNIFYQNIAINKLERMQLLLQRRKDESKYVKSVVHNMMLYIGSDLADDSIFDVYTSDGDAVSPTDPRYVSMYIDNIKEFLDYYPDFYSSIETIQSPFYDAESRELIDLYFDLYFMTTKYPGNFYIVPIQKIQKEHDQNIYTTVGIEVLIPYFNQDGTFELFGENILEQYFDEERESQDESIKYYYGPITIMRVPNMH